MPNKPKGHWESGHYISVSTKGHWSKWGGGRYGNQVEELNGEWTCQACREKQFDFLPYFLVEYPIGEYVKVCGMCHYVVLRYRLQSFLQLIERVRKTNLLSIIANLLTLPLTY